MSSMIDKLKVGPTTIQVFGMTDREPSLASSVARSFPTVTLSWFRQDIMTQNKILVRSHYY